MHRGRAKQKGTRDDLPPVGNDRETDNKVGRGREKRKRSQEGDGRRNKAVLKH